MVTKRRFTICHFPNDFGTVRLVSRYINDTKIRVVYKVIYRILQNITNYLKNLLCFHLHK